MPEITDSVIKRSTSDDHFIRATEQGYVIATLIPEDIEKIANLVIKKLKDEDDG